MDITKDKELVRAYKEETRGLLKEMCKAISKSRPDASGRGRRAVYRLFRSCHTLMEISGGIGFKEMEKVASQLLEMSRAIKDGKEDLDDDTTSLVHERIKTCRGLLDKELI